MSGNQIYQHPDGHAIDLLDGMLTVTDSDGQTASVPIGEIGLTELMLRRPLPPRPLFSADEKRA